MSWFIFILAVLIGTLLTKIHVFDIHELLSLNSLIDSTDAQHLPLWHWVPNLLPSANHFLYVIWAYYRCPLFILYIEPWWIALLRLLAHLNITLPECTINNVKGSMLNVSGSWNPDLLKLSQHKMLCITMRPWTSFILANFL